MRGALDSNGLWSLSVDVTPETDFRSEVCISDESISRLNDVSAELNDTKGALCAAN